MLAKKHCLIDKFSFSYLFNMLYHQDVISQKLTIPLPTNHSESQPSHFYRYALIAYQQDNPYINVRWGNVKYFDF